jgi:hypothetical protein
MYESRGQCLSPLRGLSNVLYAHSLGLTPQANHLPPLRGSNRATEDLNASSMNGWPFCELGGVFGWRQRGSSEGREMWALERRRRDRYIAWGASPRKGRIKQQMSPWKGRQMISLGRQPQVRGDQTTIEPLEGATDV